MIANFNCKKRATK